MTTIPLPAGAIDADELRVDCARVFHGTRRGTRAEIEILGAQDYSGNVLRCEVLLNITTNTFDPTALRELATDALAADELEDLSDLGGRALLQLQELARELDTQSVPPARK